MTKDIYKYYNNFVTRGVEIVKKVDLHIHTKKSISDYDFNFSLDVLEKYVINRQIDCIAITNHNMFDMQQFQDIKERLNITVYPGVEVDLESGHLLIISPLEKISEFILECEKLEKLIVKETDSLTFEQFRKIFPNTDSYLLIPHYKKKPMLPKEIIKKFGLEITAGEVKSHRDFGMLIKDETSDIVPVLFSDFRPTDECKQFTLRQTYIDTDELELNDIKMCFKDKNKVYLNNYGGHELFQILPDGFVASTGLNVILGERSSGKTVTLNKINETFENVKYIKQFSLIEKDEKKETQVFQERVKINKRRVSEDYLKEFKNIVDNVLEIDLKKDQKLINDYLESIKKFALETDKLDSFSKARLYTEDSFELTHLDSLTKLVSAVETLLENKEYEKLINKYINKDSLKFLLKDLIIEYRNKYKENYIKKHVNTTIHSIQTMLSLKTTVTKPVQCDFKEIFINKHKVRKFNQIVEKLKTVKEIANEELYGFTIQAITAPMKNATDVKNTYGKNVSFIESYKKYAIGYEFLIALKDMLNIPDTEIYRLFIKIDYKILNQYKLDVSGGERSEFNLLNELSDTSSYDMLLIDEPESSFDNIFLNKSVNAMIKKISKNMPVFIVTHNSTVGESIKPDYIIYTKRIIENRKASFLIYGGYPTSKRLKSVTNEEIDNFTILIDSLEGGVNVYDERKSNYEILRNKK